MSSIYIAILADYNNGTLTGEWLDLDGMDRDDFDREVARILRTSKYPNVMVDCPSDEFLDGTCHACGGTNGEHRQVPSAEEWAAHDYEGFEGISLGEYPDPDDVLRHAAMLEEHGEAWAAFAADLGDDVTEEQFEEAYQGTFDTEADWAADFLESTGSLSEIPENLRNYFDYEAYARDARLGGDVSFNRHNGTLYVFWNR